MGDQPGNERLKIDIVVQGRFHSFALASALVSLGHDVVLHTNYPASIVARFGISQENVRSFIAHGVATRVANWMGRLQPRFFTEPMFHTSFGHWAARSVREDADLIHGFSGVMEEILDRPRSHSRQVRMLVRGSAHIQEQARLLEEEELRVGVRVDRPSQWMIAREEREYALADVIVVLSRFAFDSFVERRISPERLQVIPLGVDLSKFGGTTEVIDARERRMLGGERLRVLTVGALSARKGAFELIKVATALRCSMDFDFVGDTMQSEVGRLLALAPGAIRIGQRVPEAELPAIYAKSDIFLFPTIEDGFAAVLLQASAGGLPVLATTNCSARDFIIEGETGWVLPIRDAEGFVRRLEWCDQNRAELARIARKAGREQLARGWKAAALELVAAYYHRLAVGAHA